MTYKQKILIVLGPTASGKSALAVRLAKEFDGEIISADSRQVYKGLDIGTGKITKREMAEVPHHLLDVASPRRVFTAHEYVEKARAAVSLIATHGKLPIICGGTAFYIDTLLGDMRPAPVPPNLELRKNLKNETTGALFKKLQVSDPARAEKIDAKNRHRLIRAIEIAAALGKTPQQQKIVLYDALKIGIRLPPEQLRGQIKTRLAVRMKKGMAAEARRLHENGLSWARMDALGLEYRFLARFLRRKIMREEMLTQLETAIWRYAKRQMTWWKHDKKINWLSLNDFEDIRQTIAFFIQNSKFQIPNSGTLASPRQVSPHR